MNRARVLWLLALVALTGSCQADDPPVERVSCEVAARPAGLAIGGTGAGLAMLQRLARQWEQGSPGGAPVVVVQAIGSAGGLKALREGQLDVAILARPLKEGERDGLIATPIAATPLVFATRKPAPVRTVTSEQLIRWYTSPAARWPDSAGTRMTLLFREAGDGGLRAIKQAHPALGEALDHEPRSSGLGVLLQTDQQMRDALLEIPGAIGWIDLGTLSLEGLPLEPLVLDGVAPTTQALSTGRYKLALSLWLVRRADAPPEVERLVAFASSPAMRAVWAANGYILDYKEW
jgi:phosphate transport system substrate-binding protein